MVKSISTEIAERIFGKFEFKEAPGGWISVAKSWVDDNIVKLEAFGLTLSCHKKVYNQFNVIFADLKNKGLINEIVLSGGGGCYAARHKSSDPLRPLSLHSWGIALDNDPQKYPYGQIEPKPSAEIVMVFEKWGFVWGGNFRTPDNMHFEWNHFITE